MIVFLGDVRYPDRSAPDPVLPPIAFSMMVAHRRLGKPISGRDRLRHFGGCGGDPSLENIYRRMQEAGVRKTLSIGCGRNRELCVPCVVGVVVIVL